MGKGGTQVMANGIITNQVDAWQLAFGGKSDTLACMYGNGFE